MGPLPMENFTAQKETIAGSKIHLVLQHSQENLAVNSCYKALITNQTKQNRQLAVHGDHTSIANCQTKSPADISSDVWILRGHLKCLRTYSTFPRGNCGWETMNCALEESFVKKKDWQMQYQNQRGLDKRN